MIPPYKSNHASTIEQLPDGTLAVAWFSGEKEEADGCAIVFATLPAGSKQFTKAATLSERDGYSNQNPVLFYDPKTKILHLYHSQAKAKSGESKSTIMELTSTDSGKTWTKPALLFSFPGAFPRNRIIPSLDGGLLFPIYDASKSNVEGANFAIIEKSNVAHTNWTKIDIKDSQGKVQPTCVRLLTKNLRCWFRDRAAGFIYVSDSTDDGLTWTKPAATQLPNPNVGIEANSLTSGNIVMVFNNYNKSTAGPNGRTPLNVAISKDGGTTWHMKDLQVHDDEKTKAEGKLEYSYPSVLQTAADGLIHITYTYDRNTIKYRRVTEEWILA
jgi:predicted neuraminidase